MGAFLGKEEQPIIFYLMQVASNAAAPEHKGEHLLNVGSEIATLKHIVLELMHAQSGRWSAAPPEQVILARKPIAGYRCTSALSLGPFGTIGTKMQSADLPKTRASPHPSLMPGQNCRADESLTG